MAATLASMTGFARADGIADGVPWTVAARALLAEAANIGRQLEFLVQEFNREANTLCGKSASLALTATGLRLKAAIEQLREQAANIE